MVYKEQNSTFTIELDNLAKTKGLSISKVDFVSNLMVPGMQASKVNAISLINPLAIEGNQDLFTLKFNNANDKVLVCMFGNYKKMMGGSLKNLSKEIPGHTKSIWADTDM